LQIDANTPQAIPFEQCVPMGCIVRAPLATALLNEMKAGATATLIVPAAPGEWVKLPISLDGFTAAFNSL